MGTYKFEGIYSKLRDYQQDCVSAIFNTFNSGAHSSLVVLPTSCLSGDTIININRGCGNRRYTIKEAAMRFGSYPKRKGVRGFDKSKPSKIRSFNGDTIQLKDFLEVAYSGVKETYTMELESGHTIRCTADHKIQTRNGMVRLDKLTIGESEVMLDTPNPSKSKKTPVNMSTACIRVGDYHPFAGTINSKRDGAHKRTSMHIAIYEAARNKMTIGEYKAATMDSEAVKTMEFVDSSKYHIHHINHDHLDNRVENLCCLPKAFHLKHHAKDSVANFNQGIPEYSKVKSIEYYGEEDTFDVIEVEEHHNFVANGIVVSNSGKTYIIGAVIKRYLEKNDKKALMLSHLDILTQQNEEALRTDWKINTGILQAGIIPAKNKECIVSTMQSFRSEEKVDIWGKLDDIGLCVIDEVHMYGSSSYNKIMEMLPPSCIVLGATATPFRQNMDMSSMFETTAYTISMQDLIDKKMLVPPVLKYMPVKTDEEFGSIVKKIVTLYSKNHKGQKTIVFLRTIAQCNELADRARAVGINAKAITSKVIGKERYDCIDAFKAGEAGSADMLITVDVLTAGFSSNNVRSIFMPFMVGSVTSYLQRIGRGMRLDPNDPSKVSLDVYVGGPSPQITNQKYQDIQRIALTAGRPDVDIPVAPINESSDSLLFDEVTLELSKELSSKGADELASLVIKEEFPQQFLDNLTEMRHIKSKALSKQKPTYEESAFLAKHRIDFSNMNRLDAVYAVSAILEAKGFSKASLYAQDGKYKNVPYLAIPNMYLRTINRNPWARSFYTHRKINKNLYASLDSV